MSKLGKITLGLGMFLLMAGGLLALTGWFMGGETSIEYTRNGYTVTLTPLGIRGVSSGRSGSYESVGVDGIHLDGTEAFQSIDVNVTMADVTLMESDGYGVYLDWGVRREALQYTLSDGALVIWDSWNGVNVGMGVNDGEDYSATVTVYYPSGAGMDTVALNSAMGDVDIYDLTADSLTVESNMGDVYISGGRLGTADLTLDMGGLEADDLVASGQVTAVNHMGSIDLSGALRDMDLTSNMGSITVYTSEPRDKFSYDLKVGMGDISYAGSSAHGGLSGGSGVYSIKASCDMGDIDIEFD